MQISKSLEEELNQFLENFNKACSRVGLKYSIQREWIIKALFLSDRHLSVDELVAVLKERFGVRVSTTTVYRNLKSLIDLKIVDVLETDEKQKKYEIRPNIHHDHLVCRECGVILEFYNKTIEELQSKIANENGFILTSHVLTLYGICKNCKDKR